jgi:hypothetical protein
MEYLAEMLDQASPLYPTYFDNARYSIGGSKRKIEINFEKINFNLI